MIKKQQTLSQGHLFPKSCFNAKLFPNKSNLSQDTKLVL